MGLLSTVFENAVSGSDHFQPLSRPKAAGQPAPHGKRDYTSVSLALLRSVVGLLAFTLAGGLGLVRPLVLEARPPWFASPIMLKPTVADLGRAGPIFEILQVRVMGVSAHGKVAPERTQDVGVAHPGVAGSAAPPIRPATVSLADRRAPPEAAIAFRKDATLWIY